MTPSWQDSAVMSEPEAPTQPSGHRADAAPRSGLGGTGLALPLNLLLPVSGLVDVARQAEALGYDRVWAAEAGTNDAFALLTACAGATERIGLATGVVPIFTRTPSLMAASAATLQDVCDGRFTLGLGVSSPAVVTAWNAVAWDRPVARIREYAGLVAELLAGAKVSREGGLYPVRGYQLMLHRPDPPPSLVLGALGPTMLDVAGEVSASALLNFVGVPAVPEAIRRVRQGSARASRACRVATAAFVRVCVTEDSAAAETYARREVMSYVTVPSYRRAFAGQGWGEACDEAMRRWEAGDRRGAAGSLPEQMVASLVLYGDGADVRGRFEAFRDAGLDEPIAFVVSGQRDPAAASAEVAATMRALAPRAERGDAAE
jgi:probable F420-dependent oxidoreductase